MKDRALHTEVSLPCSMRGVLPSASSGAYPQSCVHAALQAMIRPGAFVSVMITALLFTAIFARVSERQEFGELA